jgi:hypothetical protein
LNSALSELALSRAHAYLRLHGVPLSREVILEVLALVRELLEQDEDDARVLAGLLERLRERFLLPEQVIPPVCPPLCRGSIHYEP